jgi:hypothetical protein
MFMSNPIIHVIFRACDMVTAVNKCPRPYDLDKTTLIKVCFRSLYDALQTVPHTITVLGDKLSPDLVDFFSQYNVALSNNDFGNDESIRQSVKKALTFPNDEWVYLCEDDYLHRPETFLYINSLIKEKGSLSVPNKKMGFLKLADELPELVIFPPDYPDRYQPKDREPSFIFPSSHCHWRQVVNTTFTLLLQVKTLKRHLHIFEKASKGANDAYLSKSLYGRNGFGKKCLCLSPMPGLTSHMHETTISPLINWEQLVKKHLH